MGARHSESLSENSNFSAETQSKHCLNDVQPQYPTLKSPGTNRRKNLKVTFDSSHDQTDNYPTKRPDFNGNSIRRIGHMQNGGHAVVTKNSEPAYSRSRYDQSKALNNGSSVSSQHGSEKSYHKRNNLGSTRNNRSRSVSPSPRQARHVTLINEEQRENLKNSHRTRSQSASRINNRHPGKNKNMTSFVIGSPAIFRPGGFGDLGVFKSISAVSDHLFICGAMALSEEKVKALRIDTIINATLEWPSMNIPGLETVRVTVDDTPNAPLHMYFDSVADKMNKTISRGGRVLVHCMAGISRSSTLCIAYLMKYKGLSLQQALSLMKTRRSIIRPNDGFFRQLVEYERKLRSANKLVRKTFETPKTSEHRKKSESHSSTLGRSGQPRPLGLVNSQSRVATLPSRAIVQRSASLNHQQQLQKDIAASALRNHGRSESSNWRTTYGNDYNRSTLRR